MYRVWYFEPNSLLGPRICEYYVDTDPKNILQRIPQIILVDRDPGMTDHNKSLSPEQVHVTGKNRKTLTSSSTIVINNHRLKPKVTPFS